MLREDGIGGTLVTMIMSAVLFFFWLTRIWLVIFCHLIGCTVHDVMVNHLELVGHEKCTQFTGCNLPITGYPMYICKYSVVKQLIQNLGYHYYFRATFSLQMFICRSFCCYN